MHVHRAKETLDDHQAVVGLLYRAVQIEDDVRLLEAIRQPVLTLFLSQFFRYSAAGVCDDRAFDVINRSD